MWETIGRNVRGAVNGAKYVCMGHLFVMYVGYPRGTLGPSMLPTIALEKDYIWIDTTYRRGRGIRIGDVISAWHPSVPEEGLSKRVLGMPGDFIRIDSPGLKNREKWDDRSDLEGLRMRAETLERELGGPGELTKQNWDGKWIQIPEGHCWLEGDNVPWSKDSRDYGPVPLALIKGKVTASPYPFSRFRWINNNFEDASD